jgi:anti-anti-sigma regulatory factor
MEELAELNRGESDFAFWTPDSIPYVLATRNQRYQASDNSWRGSLLGSKSAKTVVLPQDSRQVGDLDDVLKKLYDTLEYGTVDGDIVLDFGSIETFTPQGLFLLPTFDALAQESGHRLILKSVPPHIKTLLANMDSNSSFCFAA